MDYAANGPVVLALQGITTTQIALDPYLAVPANGLVTNEKTITENSDLVMRMVRAMQRSIAERGESGRGVRDSLKSIPEAGGENTAANRAMFDASMPYWTPGQAPSPARLPKLPGGLQQNSCSVSALSTCWCRQLTCLRMSLWRAERVSDHALLIVENVAKTFTDGHVRWRCCSQ